MLHRRLEKRTAEAAAAPLGEDVELLEVGVERTRVEGAAEAELGEPQPGRLDEVVDGTSIPSPSTAYEDNRQTANPEFRGSAHRCWRVVPRCTQVVLNSE